MQYKQNNHNMNLFKSHLCRQTSAKLSNSNYMVCKKKRERKRNSCESHSEVHIWPFLTIRQGAEDGSRAEAAVARHGARPDLHLILGGPAKVTQHYLVSVTLSVVALLLTTALLPNGNKVSGMEGHRERRACGQMTQITRVIVKS